MALHDISLTIEEGMLRIPSECAPRLERKRGIEQGGNNYSEFHLSMMTGTHIDPPQQFVQGGAPVDAIPLEHLVGPARVLDFTDVKGEISLAAMRAQSIDHSIILLKTPNSARYAEGKFITDHTYPGPEACGYLVECGVTTVAADWLSIEGPLKDRSFPVHHALLDHGVTIVEGVNLDGIAPGLYEFICLPLKIKDGDGAPARAILRSYDD